MTPRTLIAVSHLSHTYPGTRKTPPRAALKEVSLEIQAGEMVALLGPNGSGKSTFLRILMTALRPSSGEVLIDRIDPGRDARAVRRILGVVFQRPSLDGRMTVAENLRASGLLYGIPRRRIRARLEEILIALDLEERRGERVDRLSGGLARRVELARALLPQPRILVLDEPTSGLDPGARQEFWRLVGKIRQERELTVVATTHLLDEAERCDRVAVLHQGRLLAFDVPACLRRRLGEEILTIRGRDLEALARELEQELGLRGRIVDDVLCIPLAGRVSVDALIERFGARIGALTLSHPSLDDVFASLTGEHLAAVGEGGP